VISELAVEGTAEFIEIYNPGSVAVDLSTIHLTDANEYFELPGVSNMTEEIDVVTSDFLVKFPPGAVLAPKTVATIAFDGPEFATQLAAAPTYTIDVPTTGAMPMVVVIEPAPGGNVGKLTDVGELVVLFDWDGTSDLVRDVDIVVHGVPDAPGNVLLEKDAIDGPDSDDVQTAYAPEPSLMMRMTSRGPDDDRFSYKRVLLEGDETRVNGNGITGHDETSEDRSMTGDTGSMPRTPGSVAF
jgi:hypothetical protein